MKIQFVGGPLNGHYEDFNEVPAKPIGLSDDYSAARALGYVVPRAELDNQPEFKGYAGPMWDGGGLRYETWEVYNILST